MQSSTGEKIAMTLLSMVMLSSIALLTYRLIVVSPTNRAGETPLHIL